MFPHITIIWPGLMIIDLGIRLEGRDLRRIRISADQWPRPSAEANRWKNWISILLSFCLEAHRLIVLLRSVVLTYLRPKLGIRICLAHIFIIPERHEVRCRPKLEIFFPANIPDLLNPTRTLKSVREPKLQRPSFSNASKMSKYLWATDCKIL